MPIIAKAKVVLTAEDKASKTLKSLAGKFKNITASILEVGVKAAAVGAGLATALGVKAVKSAADFETGMASVSTLVDTTVESMADMNKEVLEISKRTPVALEDLTMGLFQVRSAGIDASDAMDVLERSARLGVSGLGTSEEAVNLMTGALNAFEAQGVTAEQAADVLFKTTKFGKNTIAELAQSFGMVAPIASTVGVKFDELQAATAAITTVNVPASVAQNQLRSSMVALLKPTDKMTDLLDKIGVSSGEAAIEQFGLVGTMNKLKDAAGGNTETLAEAMGRIEGLNALLALTGEQGDEFAITLDSMRNGSNAVDEAFEKQVSTFNSLWQLLKNKLQAILIRIGDIILPKLKTALEKIPWDVVEEKVINFIEKALVKLKEIWEILVAKFQAFDWDGLLSKLQSARESFAKWKDVILIVLQATSPLALLISNRGALGKGLKEIANFLQNTFAPAFRELILPLLKNLWGTIINRLVPSLKEFWRVAGPILTPVLKFLGAIIGGTVIVVITALIATIKLIIISITNWFNAFTKLINKIKSVINWFNNLNQGVKDAMKDIFELITNPFGKAFETIISGVKKALDWIKKLNPLHRESPSLVDNIKSGVEEIKKSYSQLGALNVSPILSQVQAGGASASRFGAGTTNSNTININVNNPVVREESDIQDITNAIKRELSNDLELSNRGISSNMF